MEKKLIKIFDTTLRDGEQSPGASLTKEEKIRVAQQLARLNVDIIEAGFPISSEDSFEAVKLIAKRIKGPVIAALARARREDIDRALSALKPASKARIHIFLATSEIHMRYKLHKARDEILKLATESVSYAKKFIDEIEFSPEDASRTEPEFLLKVAKSVAEAGATTINIPDTVGYTIPEEFGKLIAYIRKNLPISITISIHCHNDLGLAVANSLSAIENGATQVECTINGIGERAGNAALEEIVMALRTREDILGKKTKILISEICPASKLVSSLTGIPVQPNKAIVGENAFRHEAGIHQDGLLKKRTTYEIIDPKKIGLKGSELVLGKHSGRHAFWKRIAELGYHLKQKESEKIFFRFKRLADKKKEVTDSDLIAILEEETTPLPQVYSLLYFHTSSGTQTIPTATIKLKKNGKILEDASCGDGPVDAAYRTIDRMVGLKSRLLDYKIKAVTSGKDALGEVSLKLEIKKRIVAGRAVSTDIIEASAKAYLNAINRYLATKK